MERAKCGNPVGRSPGILESRRFPGQLIDWPATVGRTDGGRVERHRWGCRPSGAATPLGCSTLPAWEERVATSTLSVSLWRRAPTRKIELLVTTARDTIHENISLNHAAAAAAAAREPHCGARRSRLTLDAYFHFQKWQATRRYLFMPVPFLLENFAIYFATLLRRCSRDVISCPELKRSFHLEAKIVGYFLLFDNKRFNKKER